MPPFRNLQALSYLPLSIADMCVCVFILAYGYVERKLKVLLKNLFCNNAVWGDLFFPFIG